MCRKRMRGLVNFVMMTRSKMSCRKMETLTGILLQYLNQPPPDEYQIRDIKGYLDIGALRRGAFCLTLPARERADRLVKRSVIVD